MFKDRALKISGKLRHEQNVLRVCLAPISTTIAGEFSNWRICFPVDRSHSLTVPLPFRFDGSARLAVAATGRQAKLLPSKLRSRRLRRERDRLLP